MSYTETQEGGRKRSCNEKDHLVIVAKNKQYET